jgi:4,4'-diaponeurosporenoate glycosyltransferase
VGALGLTSVALGWFAGTLLLWRLPALRPAPHAAVDAASTTSVVIPARDEAVALPGLLASLAAQQHPPLEVIVVDDGSTDDTATVARSAGATVCAAPELASGWLGKPAACHHGTAASAGDRLVFLDADTTLAPDGLARLLAAHDELTPDGLLSVQPHHLVERPHEQLSALCNVVPVMASGMAAPGDHDSEIAFGPCLVTTRTALDAVGGWASARHAITEDVALAQAFRADGRPVRCLAGGSSVRFRMYPQGLASLVEGWTKNLAAGAAHAPRLPTLGAIAWVASLATVAVAGIDALATWTRHGGAPDLVVVVLWAAVSAQLWWMLRRLGSFRWWCAVAFPVPLAAFVLLFLRSLALRVLGRPVTWRGRRIPVRAGAR